MDISLLAIAGASFVLSFVFALGGIGSALVLIPLLGWFGVPFPQARSIGLFVNTVSMAGATLSNIRNKRLDFRLGLPIILASVIMAPIGALAGLHLPTGLVRIAFIAFLVFSSLMMLFFIPSKNEDQFRQDLPIVGPFLTGSGAGFISGLLGVGGGGFVAPLMNMQGFNPKKVATITPFAVPFSSFTAFLTYTTNLSMNWTLLLFAGLAAWAGGYLGTIFMQTRLKPGFVKKFLAISILLLAVRMML